VCVRVGAWVRGGVGAAFPGGAIGAVTIPMDLRHIPVEVPVSEAHRAAEVGF